MWAGAHGAGDLVPVDPLQVTDEVRQPVRAIQTVPVYNNTEDLLQQYLSYRYKMNSLQIRHFCEGHKELTHDC